MELTDKIVESALYEGRSYMSKGGRKRWSQHVLWDDSLPGFGLRITSTNRKSFFVSYRAGGRKRTKTLGTADRLSLSEARRRAAELLDAAEETPGRAAAVEEAAGVETVAQLADAYLEKHLKSTAPSWFADQRLMRTHIKPALGRSKVAEVTLTDLANLRGRVGRRFPGDARRLKLLLDGMFNWAAERGLWSGSPREAARARARREAKQEADAETGTERAPEAAAQAEPEAAVPLTRAELEAALAESESRRRELTAQLEELSTSGVDMLRKLNEQATDQQKLESELAESRRELDRLEARNAELPDPEKAEKQMANLRQSVEQLMDSVSQAESERDRMAQKLAAVEKRAQQQSQKVVALARARNELESKALEQERQEAIRKVHRRTGGAGRRRAVLLAAGVVAGVLATLLLQRILPDEQGTELSTTRPAEARDALTEPQDPGSSSATESESRNPRASAEEDVVAAAAEPSAETSPAEPGPDPAAADEAVAAWAAAWSEQRVDAYLAAYSTEFRPAGGLRRDEWVSQRRNRIQRPRFIRVGLGPLSRTVLDDGRVSLTFEQSYETESYSDQVVKTLELVWEDGAWKIASERTG